MNRLKSEKSPYLLQHAENPVDWYPWGDEAFRKAKTENKPIFLSIGYSTCHWCHVMERESFENESVAALMNEKFVNIKVDREERPDVDKVYMAAVQTMTGSGGWPLSVFLTPELKPFYGGTYFPPNDAYGRPGFSTLLHRINEVWQSERENVIYSSDELTKSLQHSHPVDIEGAVIEEQILKRTYHQLAAGYDPKFAGFGTGPKFPRPVVFNFLFNYYNRTKEAEALSMSLTSLMAMASGGMYDHIGGGFHRYSVDNQWRVPHFEKMLYDQALLVHSYLDAYQFTHDKFFADIARETVDYVLRDMTSPEGGFYSAEDADSPVPEHPGEKKEGAFYTWTKKEITEILTNREAEVFCHYYGVEEYGNALSDPQGEFSGKNILYAPFTVEQTASALKMNAESAGKYLATAKRKVFNARNARPRPHRDDKLLTSWNGLMIGACARASLVLKEESYRIAAERAAHCLLDRLYDSDANILLRRYRDGASGLEAHLDDYAFFIAGLLDIAMTTSDVRWISTARELAGTMIALFWDSSEGGFFDTSGKDPSILVRMKESYDSAEPTGNSVAVHSLIRLHRIFDDPTLVPYIEKTLKYFSVQLSQSPQLMPQLMVAIDFYLTPPEHIVIAKGSEGETIQSFSWAAHQHFRPFSTVLYRTEPLMQLLGKGRSFLESLTPVNDTTTAYHCFEFACKQPVTSLTEFDAGFAQ